MMQKSTKIVATLGPASSERDVLTRMIAGGVDVVRMNFSHGTKEEHLARAELVRDVVTPKEFDEFCRFDYVTVLNGGRYFRIPRRPHALIEVWDAKTQRPLARLCVVFQDPGMPPSDEVVMKYLLAKHQPDLLWQVGVKFSPPAGRFEAIAPKRWATD